MNRLLQNGRLLSSPTESRHSSTVDTGLDLTLRLGLPGSYRGSHVAAAQQQHRYGFVGPVRPQPQPTIIPDIARDHNTSVRMMNQPAGDFDILPFVQTERIVRPALWYGQSRPGSQPQMYMGYTTTSAVTIRSPPFEPISERARAPSSSSSSIRTRRPYRIRTYAPYPDQRCNNISCNTRVTPKWRNGPYGPKTLCNACGIEFRKCKESIGRLIGGD